METHCEIIWCRITLKNNKTLHVASYYRPQENDVESLEQLDISLKRLHSSNSAIFVGGDFNAPGWDWKRNQLKPGHRNPNIYTQLIEVLDDSGLQQFVDIPTREQNVLDLMCTNAPGRISSYGTLPGVSDHQIVCCTMNILPLRRLQKPRWILQYHKANWEKMRKELEKLNQDLAIQEQSAVEYMWNTFKERLHMLTKEHVPRKMSRKIQRLPYINREIEKLIKKRNRLHRKMKKKEKNFEQSTHIYRQQEEKFKSLRNTKEDEMSLLGLY